MMAKVHAKVTEYKEVEASIEELADAAAGAVLMHYGMTANSWLSSQGHTAGKVVRYGDYSTVVVVPAPTAEQLEVLDLCLKFVQLASKVNHAKETK